MTDLIDTRYMLRDAEFDEPDRFYRYKLWRVWAHGPRVLWIMLNPSTADENVLDPTLRRCEGFSRAWGYGGFAVANLYAYRSTDPKELRAAQDGYVYPVQPPHGATGGDRNDAAIRELASDARLIVCGWGSEKIAHERKRLGRRSFDASRADVVTNTVLQGVTLHCLGTNADGAPKHPLYLSAKTGVRIFAQNLRVAAEHA